MNRIEINRLCVRLNLLLLVVLSGVSQQATATVDDISYLFGKFASADEINPFYGTLTMFAADAPYYYYLTNAHALPVAAVQQRKLKVTLQFRGEQHYPSDLIGISPGYDLAVVRVRRIKNDPKELTELQKILKAVFRTAAAGPLTGYKHMAMIGVEGRVYGGELMFKNLFWQEELEVFERRQTLGKQTEYKLRWRPNTLSLNKALVQWSADCPSELAFDCILLPMRSWGYSGGALLVSDHYEIDNSTQVGGIVSYFTPMSGKTLVIPMDLALIVGRCLANLANCSYDPRNYDLTGKVEFISPGCYRIRTGEHAGKLLLDRKMSRCLLSPSDPEHLRFYPLVAITHHATMGGGGSSMGGGGSSMGGGGASPINYDSNAAVLYPARLYPKYFIDDYGNLAITGDAKTFASRAENVHNWCSSDDNYVCDILLSDPVLRGSHLFIQPFQDGASEGFMLGSKVYPKSDFYKALKCHLVGEDPDCFSHRSEEQLDIPWNDLTLAPGIKYGLYAEREFHQSVTNEELKGEPGYKEARVGSLELLLLKIRTALINHYESLPLTSAQQKVMNSNYFDVISSRGTGDIAPISGATISRSKNKLVIHVHTKKSSDLSSAEQIVLELDESSRRQKGDAVIYRAQANTPVFVHLEFDKERQFYELRILSATVADFDQAYDLQNNRQAEVEYRFYSREPRSIVLFWALYLPLVSNGKGESGILGEKNHLRDKHYADLPALAISPRTKFTSAEHQSELAKRLIRKIWPNAQYKVVK